LLDPNTIRVDDREESKGEMIYDTAENEGGNRAKISNHLRHGDKLEEDKEKEKIKGLRAERDAEQDMYNENLKNFEYDLKDNYEKTKQTLQKYDVQAIEFSWLFRSQDRKIFLTALGRSPDLEIFSVKLVENIISFMWTYYRIIIFLFSLLPYLIYFITFLIYGNWIQQDKFDESSETGEYHVVDYILAVIIILMIIFNAYLEARRIMYAIMRARELKTIAPVITYITSFWNFINVCSLVLNTVVVITDLAQQTERDIIPVLAIATLLMWFKLFYFGRMFKGLAGMVRMIHSVFMRLGNFMIILGVMILGFANMFYVMSRIQANGFIGDDFWDALTYSYL
jgi:hypothetical protein